MKAHVSFSEKSCDDDSSEIIIQASYHSRNSRATLGHLDRKCDRSSRFSLGANEFSNDSLILLLKSIFSVPLS